MALLDILIPTMPCRKKVLARLLGILEPQAQKQPGVQIVVDAGADVIGPKRDRMVAESRAEYVVFVDDDDLVADNYVEAIVAALQDKPDCVSIKIFVKHDGQPMGPEPVYEHSIKYRDHRSWGGNFRTPHHLCPIRRELACKATFGNKAWAEDHNFAMGILPYLQTEAEASDHPLYLYEYCSRKPFDSEA